MMMITPEKAGGGGATGLSENNGLDKQNCWIPETPVKSMERVYKGRIPGRRTDVVKSMEKIYKRRRPERVSRASEHQNSWIPGTIPKLIPRRLPENNQALNSEEKASMMSSGFPCLSTSGGFLDLKKSPVELTVPVPDVATSGGGLTDEHARDQLSWELNKILVDLNSLLEKTPARLMNSFNVAITITPETTNSTPPGAADCNLSEDSQNDRSIKKPEGWNFWYPPLWPNQHNPTSTSENLLKGAEKCASQDVQLNAGHQNTQEDMNSKRRMPKLKPKKKKHRPRVVFDRKQKKPLPQPKTPKPVTPKKKKSRRKSNKNQSRDEKTVLATADPQPIECPVVSKEFECVELPTKKCELALNFNLENHLRNEKNSLADPQAEPQTEFECFSLRKEFEFDGHQFGEVLKFKGKNKRSKRRRRFLMIYLNTKKRSKRRRRLNTLFLLTFIKIKFPTKRNRLRRLPRKCSMSLLTAFPICNQLPKLPPKRAENENIQNSSLIYDLSEKQLPKLPSKQAENEDIQNSSFSYDPESEYVNFQGCASKYEEFLLTTKFTDVGSQEVLQADHTRIDYHNWQSDFWLGDKSNSLCVYPDILPEVEEVLPDQEVLQISQEISRGQIINQDLSQLGYPEYFFHGSPEILPSIGFQEILPGSRADPFMQKNTWSGCFQEFLQRNDNAVQKIDDAFWLPLQSKGSEALQQVNNGDIQDHSALVPYQRPVMLNNRKQSRKRKMKHDFNTDGALVLYQESSKPKKLSAKVDLDEVSLKMWEQLEIGNGDEEKVDEEKWRKEREVMEGRIESFVARMHMILGDRRFKPWKGSVVDSVVGVYLTQNVSDNLSSNAYMSLASKFPLGSTFNGGSPESSGSNNMSSIGRVYDPQGNMYYVTELELKRTNTNVESTSKICSVEISASLTKLSQLLESLTLHGGDNILSPEEHLGDAYHEKKASTSKRTNEPKDAFESITLTYSNDHFEHSISAPIGFADSNLQQSHGTPTKSKETKSQSTPRKKKKVEGPEPEDWEFMRKMYSSGEPRSIDYMDSVDWEAVRCADVSDIAEAIQDRGQHNVIAGRIKDFLNRLVQTHNCIDLEWLRNAPPDKVKKYLLEIPGLGLKSVECVRLLSLQHVAFPVDTNVARIAVRLGWVPIQPLPEQMYPVMDHIQKYLWPRLCHLDQRTLYELHYQLITFGKVFCTKRNPHCSACPLRGECKHFASAFASARLALPGPLEKRMVKSKFNNVFAENPPIIVNPMRTQLLHFGGFSYVSSGLTLENQENNCEAITFENQHNNCEPIIEEPPSPERHHIESSYPIESSYNMDTFCIGDIEDVPTIRLQERKFQENLQNFMKINNIVFQDSKALVALTAEAASISIQKLKTVDRLRTEHLVYVLPDNHELLQGFERRLDDDPCPYLLAIWSPGETPNSIEPPKTRCNFNGYNLCDDQTCYNCNRIREENADIVRGTILIPCLTANRGRFPLNGTYFQVNEVFADHETSERPINVPSRMIANLTKQIAYFGSTASHISKALDIESIQRCFWRGFICVRGFDRRCRAPRPLLERFHCSPSKIVEKKKQRGEGREGNKV